MNEYLRLKNLFISHLHVKINCKEKGFLLAKLIDLSNTGKPK